MTREVVTLQFGHYANHVGTHWWNLQEAGFVYQDNSQEKLLKEINNDVLFREGQNLQRQVTYTPRLVTFDLKGSLNALKQDGVLYDIPDHSDHATWSGDITLHKADVIEKNSFQRKLDQDDTNEEIYDAGIDKSTEKEIDVAMECASTSGPEVFGPRKYSLEDQVKSWTDFLRIHLHPKSNYIINQYQHKNDLQPFDVFGYGELLLSESREREEIENRIHFFLEECDCLQGLQVLVDVFDGFGGLASSVLEELQEDYSGKSIMIWSLSPPTFPESTTLQRNYRLYNSLLSYSRLLSLASAVCPLSLTQSLWGKPSAPLRYPHLNYQADLHYHTSAILAAAVESGSLPYRLEKNPSLMSHLVDALSEGGRKVISSHLALPLPISPNQTMFDCLLKSGDNLPLNPVSPYCERQQQVFCQSVVCQGIPAKRLKSDADIKRNQSLLGCTTMEEMLRLHIENTNSVPSAIHSISQAMSTSLPFPHIFKERVSETGFLSDKPRAVSSTGVKSIPVMSALQCSTSGGHFLDALAAQAGRLDARKFHKVFENGLEFDQYKEMLEGLRSTAELYNSTSCDMR